MRTWVVVSFLLASVADAATDAIDLSNGWVFRTDPNKEGIDAGWMNSDFNDSEWKPIAVGKRWEEEGYPEFDGVGWYRLRFDLPAPFVTQWASLQLGGVNDACTIYCNGALFDSYGDDSSHSMHDTTVIAMLGKLLKPGEKNVIAVRVLDWGGSGGLWRGPVQLRLDAKGLPWADLIQFRADTRRRQLHVDLEARSFGNTALEHPIAVTVSGGRFSAEKQVPAASSATFDVAEPSAETFFAKVAYHDASGPEVGSAQYRWPTAKQWPKPFSALTIQNNFVTTLYRRNVDGFLNPRAGWVNFSYSNPSAETPPELFLDAETAPLQWRRDSRSKAWEAMRYLDEGKHGLRNMELAADGLDIRAVPEIAFCYYPYTYNVAAFGAPGQKFMDEHVLAETNTIVTRSSEIENAPFFARWKEEGRQWLANGHLPGLGAPTPPEPQAVADEWLQNPGVINPGYAGLIVDEFTGATEGHYRAWTQALQTLHDAPAMHNKMFYAWCVDIYRASGPIEFGQRLKDLGYTFVWEKYLREEPTAEIADRWINQSMAQRLEEWQRVVPGIERNLIVCLGYMSAPPESLDVDPCVDYSVFLDMQFNALANDPRFFGLRGVMAYMSNYADEEYVRYTQELIRHYCIEGRRERMNDDPYILPHVTNPDFANGLDGWTVDAAEEGAVSSDTMDGFSFLQGRYPRYKEGDTFCRMERAGSKPNRVSQTVRALTPGRLYSLKMFSANIERLEQNAKTGFRITVEGADVLDRYAFDFVFPSCYSHEVPPYNSDHPAYMTYHRRVFRATAGTATVTLSDDDAPADQATAFNFVQVQPFRAP